MSESFIAPRTIRRWPVRSGWSRLSSARAADMAQDKTGWSHGYDVSLGYTYNFHREMAPGWMDFCVGAHGFEPERRGSGYRYLDLGCGQGFGLCLLAAANPDAEFIGIDFQAE